MPGVADDGNDRLMQVYEQLCTSYHDIDDFRMKLLGLLPLASGGGIFLLLNSDQNNAEKIFFPLGIFGFLVTLGLFSYEIYGIRKCHALIEGGKEIECKLQLTGHFSKRPNAAIGFVNEPLASAIIYPAVLAAWTYLALFKLPFYLSAVSAVWVFVLFCGLVLVYKSYLANLPPVECDQKTEQGGRGPQKQEANTPMPPNPS